MAPSVGPTGDIPAPGVTVEGLWGKEASTERDDTRRSGVNEGTQVELNLTLCLPRDEMSIPVARQVCKNALTVIGVERGCIGDIEVAITEACANVLQHSAADDEYEVRVQIDDTRCVIRVVDNGRGFDFRALSEDHGKDVSAESGRGILMIKALVDKVRFESLPEDGMVVHLEKNLEYESGAPMERLRTSSDG